MPTTPDPELPTADLTALEALARAGLDPQAYDYIARGSGDGLTVAENTAAWHRLLLRPRVLSDVSSVDTRTTVLGTSVAMPILVAPTAMHRFACDEGECATARAAASSDTLMVVSMAATTSLEDVAASAPQAPRWAQMYMLRDRGRTRALASRARAAGYRAIVASVDGAAVPYGRDVGGRGGAGGSLTPPAGFRFPNLASSSEPDDEAVDLMSLVSDFDPSVGFDDLSLFGEWSGLPVVVKGVLRGDDALRCTDAGARGILVSNHGGRMVDGTVPTAAALPEVADAVRGRAEVYVDGGIRTGTDVVRALALGARAVLVGRPVLWGLAVAGERGAAGVLEALGADFRRVMAFCGARRVEEVARDLLAPVGDPREQAFR